MLRFAIIKSFWNCDRGIASGIYCSNSSEACLHCLNLSRANIVVVENEKQLEKILQIKDRVSYLKSVVLLKGKSDASFVYNVSSLTALRKVTQNCKINLKIRSYLVVRYFEYRWRDTRRRYRTSNDERCCERMLHHFIHGKFQHYRNHWILAYILTCPIFFFQVWNNRNAKSSHVESR